MASLLLLLLAAAAGALGQGWNEDVTSLPDLQAAEFKAFVSPIIQIAANAYRYPQVEQIPGWRPADRLEPLAPCIGAHAVVYEELGSGRIVLAFRGTQLDSMADMCADLVIFGDAAGPRGMDFPNATQCSVFGPDQLDYFNQAVNYTSNVVKAYAGVPLLLTGHSLGAALAIMVSATLSSSSILPVVAFGSPGMKQVLESRDLSIAKAEGKHLVVSIGDEWDMISRSGWKNLVGIVCLYQREEPAACAKCWNQTTTKLSTVACTECFFETHVMSHVLELVANGSRPLCASPHSAGLAGRSTQAAQYSSIKY